MKGVVTALPPEPYRLETLAGWHFSSAALLAGNDELD